MSSRRTLRVKSTELPFSEARLDFPFIVRLVTRIQKTESPSVRSLRRRLARYEGGRDTAESRGRDITVEIVGHLKSVGIPASINHAAAIADGASSLLIFAFLERTLRALAEDLSSEVEVRRFVKRHAKRGKVGAYLRFLREKVGLSFVVSASGRDLLKQEAEIRNHFAHGDWLVHYFVADRGGAARLLQAVASLIESLDVAYRKVRRGA